MITDDDQPTYGSFAWYARRLAQDTQSLNRWLSLHYADAEHTLTCTRDAQNRRIPPAVNAALWTLEDVQGQAGRVHRLKVWAVDSLLWAGEEYALGNYTRAMRAWRQVNEYLAQLSALNDHNRAFIEGALVTLTHAIEAVTEHVEEQARQRKQLQERA